MAWLANQAQPPGAMTVLTYVGVREIGLTEIGVRPRGNPGVVYATSGQALA